ncbi:polysaccharide deacetylase [Leptospira weilii]|nr:polysaccharide deacetylase [Leptospira weilii]QDK25903.1 polysaccharide deacetylase [Leptospira weilii]
MCIHDAKLSRKYLRMIGTDVLSKDKVFLRLFLRCF